MKWKKDYLEKLKLTLSIFSPSGTSTANEPISRCAVCNVSYTLQQDTSMCIFFHTNIRWTLETMNCSPVCSCWIRVQSDLFKAAWREGSWASHSLFTGAQMGHIKHWQVELCPLLLLCLVCFVLMTGLDVEIAMGLSAAQTWTCEPKSN